MDDQQPPQQLPAQPHVLSQPQQSIQSRPVHEQPAPPSPLLAQIKQYYARFKTFVLECKRVLIITKKPDKQEFTTIVKVSSLGIALIGVIGFLVHFVKELLL